MNGEIKNKVEICASRVRNFAVLYYTFIDKKRHQIGSLYLENATISWNGNGANGREMIVRFIDGLPPSKHYFTNVDAQPILDPVVGELTTYLIQVGGNVEFGDQSPRFFQQSFIVTIENDFWKIISDCYRMQD
ncbi:NTF2-related export protein-like isoform X2 [Drosophila eugracilis]|uniref:NTF2-related export protein-like isoform X2 n=1 Tax=Drosophila eugracilis TaxID=29029 RepID=UPI0007E65B1B|nr:NTF2-related export protein-like isoform X2 [Drosophila eugracilis]